MKKSILFVFAALLLISQSSFGQAKWNLELGAGAAHSVMSKDYYYYETKGITSGVFGVYPTLTLDNFVIETGVEFLKSGGKRSSENTNYQNGIVYSSKSKDYISKINVPLQVGYTIGVSNFSFTPFMGLGLNFNLNTYSSSESVSTPLNRSTKRAYQNVFSSRITRDHYLPTFQAQLIGGVNVKLTKHLKLYGSYSANLPTTQDNYYLCCYCGISPEGFYDYCGPAGNNSIVSGEIRFGVKYAMF